MSILYHYFDGIELLITGNNENKKLTLIKNSIIILDENLDKDKILIYMIPNSSISKIDTLSLIHNGFHNKMKNSIYGYNIGLMLYDILKQSFKDSINIQIFKKLQSIFVDIVLYLSLNHSNININLLDKYISDIKLLQKTYILDEKNIKYLNRIINLINNITFDNLDDGYLYEVIFLITNIDRLISNGYLYFVKNKLYFYYTDKLNNLNELNFIL